MLLYESAGVSVTWYGLNLSEGWGEDTFLTITQNSERITYKAGADGNYTFSKRADKGCTISLVLSQVSPVNQKIAAIAAGQDLIGGSIPIAPFTIVDATGDSAHFIALNAVLTEVSDIEFGAESGERTYTWVAKTFLMAEDPVTITNALQDYLKQTETQGGDGFSFF